MNRKQFLIIILALMLMVAGSAPILTAVAASVAQESSTDNAEDAEDTLEDAEEEEEIQLSTAGVSTTLVQPGRAIVHARGNHFVVDSVPPLGGPNEERNPLDLMLGSLATCGLFVFEAGAAELGMPLESLSVAVEGDLAPKGLKDGSVNPRIREFRVMIDAQGISDEEFDILHEQWQLRCPAYTTLVLAAPIEVIRVDHEMDEMADEDAADESREANDEDADSEDDEVTAEEETNDDDG